MKKSIKKRYYILLGDDWVGQTIAISEREAVNNYWWNNVKQGDVFAERKLNPSDFDAYCID